jgi:hypothetical protein
MLPLLCWLLLLAAVASWARRGGRSAAAWAAAVGWLALPLYNVWLRKGCSGDCGIRVDLLVVAPVLLVLTSVALWGWVRRRRRK